MRWRAPWLDWGREWLEWVDDEETEFEREWMGRKSRLLGIICILTAVIGRIVQRMVGVPCDKEAKQRTSAREGNKKGKGSDGKGSAPVESERKAKEQS